MYCPFCSDAETKVLESRLLNDSMRRRRECLKCSNRFTTYEKAVFNFSVIKKDSKEELFNLEKIRNSVKRACGKIEDEDLNNLTRKIERRILSKKKNHIKTEVIGKVVLNELKNYNKIAYLRFASIHKSIDDPKMFKKEISQII